MIKRQEQISESNANGLPWKTLLWMGIFVPILFFIPQCLDRYLVPRFFMLSIVLLISMLWQWRQIMHSFSWRFSPFDLVLLGWYVLNLASVGWAFNKIEAFFYAQKVLLLLLVYAFVRQSLRSAEQKGTDGLRLIVKYLSLICCLIVSAQLIYVTVSQGLDNETLYGYASGIFGNKSLAAEFLVFLVVLNVILRNPGANQKVLWGILIWLSFLILLLQTRTAYLALFVSIVAYLGLNFLQNRSFRTVFVKKYLLKTVAVFALLSAILIWKARDSSLLERLNPANYLESATANERRFVWYKTGLLNEDHYWFGVGNGSWKFWLPSKSLKGGYRQQEQNIVFTRAHNDYLEIRSELGMVGLSLFCLIFLLAFWCAFTGAKQLDQSQWAYGAISGLAAYAVVQFFDFPRERIEMQVILALFLAFAMHVGSKKRLNIGVIRIPPKIIMGIVSILLISNVVIGAYRIKGEIHTVKMLEAQSKGNYGQVLRESLLARNPFHQYDDAIMPLEWYTGVAHFQLKHNKEALVAFETAYKQNPWSFQVLNNYASVLITTAQYAQAVPLLEQALQINPKFNDGKFNLAYAAFQQGQFDAAQSWLSQIDTISKPKRNEEFANNKAVITRKQAFQEAILQKKGESAKK
jgi:O-antigen ligase